MNRAASLDPARMTGILLSLPAYRQYGHRRRAARQEGHFRRALARMVQEIAANLNAARRLHSPALDPEREELLETIAGHLAALVKVMARRGAVRLKGDPREVVPHLRLLDSELIMYLEEAWRLSRRFLRPELGAEDVRDLAGNFFALLAALADTAEQRNQLLGLGWESEFGIPPLPGLWREGT